MRRQSALTFALLLLSGCLFDTSDTVPFQASDAGAATDRSVDPDDGLPADSGGSDAADVSTVDADSGDGDLAMIEPRYPRDQLPRGTACDDVPAEGAEHDCNPVTQNCGSDTVCEIEIRGGTMAATYCRTPGPAETFDIPWGEPCDPTSQTEHCVVGGTCLGGTCRRFCEFEGALGCESTERCDEIGGGQGIEPLGDFGACRDTCLP